MAPHSLQTVFVKIFSFPITQSLNVTLFLLLLLQLVGSMKGSGNYNSVGPTLDKSAHTATMNGNGHTKVSGGAQTTKVHVLCLYSNEIILAFFQA